MQLSIMLKKVSVTGVVLTFILGLNTSGILFGREHPRQTVTPMEEEKPHVTKEDVAKFAEEYIRTNSKGGVFKHFDKNTGKELELILDKVHKDKLTPTKKNEYFVCADFKGKNGNTYDLDFFVQGTDRSNLRVDTTSIAIHKVNGKENYTWNYNKKEDVWEKKEIVKESPEPTKKEHPGY